MEEFGVISENWESGLNEIILFHGGLCDQFSETAP